MQAVKTIEIARRVAQLGETEEALRAYALVLHGDGAPEELLEAAAYTLQNGGDYKTAYTAFVGLYRAGHFRDETLGILTQAFYEPNVKELQSRYERNCKLLKKYPYLFRKDFPAFEELPLKFYPYDDDCYVPFDTRTGELRGLVNVKDPVISRNFFRDLEKPILASDVYSQYELEYLNDNVRPSEWCARENHIYLHYESWEEFCSWLQVLNLGPLTESKKAVFLIGDELSEYPIDFKARFGIDYGGYKPRPIGVREINRLIWHTQLSSHNGGDFFNEIFDAHPNLIAISSLLFDNIDGVIAEERANLKEIRAHAGVPRFKNNAAGRTLEKLYRLKDVTDKDLFVAVFMASEDYPNEGDPTARIAPALFFQPHFPSIDYEIGSNERGDAVLECGAAEQVRKCAWMREFKYIKTFTPMRRPTTSYGGTMRVMARQIELQESPEAEGKALVVPDAVADRVLNRSYLRDPDDRLYHDAVIVRFEDGKLNPEATFTRLAAFLDLPYTETMTYCSDRGVRDPRGFASNVVGFDPATVYRTYDEYMGDDERRYIEFFLRDAYEYYGYGFQAYDGGPVDLKRVTEWVGGFGATKEHMSRSWRRMYLLSLEQALVKDVDPEALKEGAGAVVDKLVAERLQATDANRLHIAEILLRGLRFINRRGQPLQMTPLLEPDPALLRAPLYH